MENTITTTLTSLEQEWLVQKREEEALKRKEEELKRREKVLKATDIVKTRIRRAIDFQDLHLQACEHFQKALDPRWKLEITTTEVVEKERDYTHERDPETGDLIAKEDIYYQETYTQKRGRFVYQGYTISVTVSEKSPHYRWGMPTAKLALDDFRMVLNGPHVPYAYSRREIKNPTSIDRKVTEIIKTIEADRALKDRYEQGCKALEKEYKQRYPTAKVAMERDHHYQIEGTAYTRSQPQVLIVITFPNGIQATVRVWSNLSKTWSIRKLNAVDSDLDILSTISFV